MAQATEPGVEGDFGLPTRYLPAPRTRDLPDLPGGARRLAGPGLVGAGAGLASGAFVLWPYVSTQVGLVVLWGAVVGAVVQWFLNLEIERYTLATGETALVGFSRYGRHWGLFFVVLTYFANLWPGWATGSASMLTYLFGAGDRRWIAIGILLAIGAILTLAPVAYVMVEGLAIVKVAAIGVLAVLALAFVIRGRTWTALGDAVVAPALPLDELGLAIVLGAFGYAGTGGGQSLCQSNWIRDKGFGMGAHVPRLTSPVTGGKADPGANAYVFRPDEANLARWRRWWRFANTEQALAFLVVTAATIVLTSMLAHATLHRSPAAQNGIALLKAEGVALQALAGTWFGYLFWAVGAFALFAASAGIVDYTSRLAADLIKARYLRAAAVTESTLYFWLVWGLVALGVTVLVAGVDQPLVLLVISACAAATMAFFYSALLWWMNSRALPGTIRIGRVRSAVLLLACGTFGLLAVLTIRDQFARLL